MFCPSVHIGLSSETTVVVIPNPDYMMRIVIDGDITLPVIPTPHPKDKPTFILYLFRL